MLIVWQLLPLLGLRGALSRCCSGFPVLHKRPLDLDRRKQPNGRPGCKIGHPGER
jgi:hypothetical protein